MGHGHWLSMEHLRRRCYPLLADYSLHGPPVLVRRCELWLAKNADRCTAAFVLDDRNEHTCIASCESRLLTTRFSSIRIISSASVFFSHQVRQR
jgi:hypothetical protein